MVLAGLVVAFGALVQGTAGFGLALVAAPLLAILDPTLVPVPLILVSSLHAVLALAREYRDTDWAGVGWALLGRLPGIALGALAVAVLPQRWFLILVAVIVLICVALSATRWRPRPTVPALLAGGLVSGVGGTAASIGGPPVALLYQDRAGPTVRATMAAYFTGGSVLSLVALTAVGRVDLPALGSTGLLLPFMAAGFLLSTPARRLLDRGWTRPAVLGMSAVAALVLLVTALLA